MSQSYLYIYLLSFRVYSHAELPWWFSGKESACHVGDLDLIPGLGRSPRERNGNPLQHSCLENPMDRGAWWAAVHGVARVGHDWATSLSLFTFMHWRRKWQPTPVFLPGESQGWGSLVGYSPWGRQESDTTETLHFLSFFLSIWVWVSLHLFRRMTLDGFSTDSTGNW